MSSSTYHTSSVSHFVDDVTCPRCRVIYDDTQQVHHTNPDARFPIKLIPCGCTCCRLCIRQNFAQNASRVVNSPPSSSQQQQQPQCPLCSGRIEITQFDEAVLALVRSAQTQLQASSQYGAGVPAAPSPGRQPSLAFVSHHIGFNNLNNSSSNNVSNGGYSGAPADSTTLGASLGPLDPAIRQEILARCRNAEDASRAEHFARSVRSLQRTIEFTKTDFDAAKAERDAAADTADAKGKVVSTLQSELKELDAKIAALNLDRQVIVHQLQASISEQSRQLRYKTECDMRMLEIQRRIQAEATELEARIKAVQQLAPGVQL